MVWASLEGCESTQEYVSKAGLGDESGSSEGSQHRILCRWQPPGQWARCSCVGLAGH